MQDTILELDGVYKKFRRGEIYDSLRDLIPAITGRYLKQRGKLIGDREFWALEDVSFRLGRGEAVGIIGRNGAGKSTILKILSGVLKPSRGTVTVGGRLSALIEVGAGFHPDLTGRENIFLNGAILGMGRTAIRSKFDDIVEFSGLQTFIDTPVKRYSSGMYARLGFSVAVHVDPEILLVDEVLSVGDLVFQNRCMERMDAIQRSGTTVIFVSHNLRAVARLCRRSILLDKGKVVLDGETNEVLRSYLDRARTKREGPEGKAAYITKMVMRDEDGPKFRFRSGQEVWIDIEFLAQDALDKVAVGLEIRDESQYPVFHTSTQRLGHPTWSLEPGQRVRVRFQLTLHLGFGTFHAGLHVFRSDVQAHYDSWVPASTFYVQPDLDVRGAANLYPRVVVPEDDAIER